MRKCKCIIKQTLCNEAARDCRKIIGELLLVQVKFLVFEHMLDLDNGAAVTEFIDLTIDTLELSRLSRFDVAPMILVEIVESEVNIDCLVNLLVDF